MIINGRLDEQRTFDSTTEKFEKFDPTLGTLTNVTVDVKGELYVSWQEFSASCSSIFGLCSSAIVVSGFFYNGVGFFEDPASARSPLIDGRSYQLNGSMSEFLTERTLNVDSTQSFDGQFDGTIPFDQIIRDKFTGTGFIEAKGLVGNTFGVDAICRTNGALDIVTGCDGTLFLQHQLTYDVSVTYEYTPAVVLPAPVPLPAGLPLLISGFGFLALFGRRQKQ